MLILPRQLCSHPGTVIFGDKGGVFFGVCIFVCFLFGFKIRNLITPLVLAGRNGYSHLVEEENFLWTEPGYMPGLFGAIFDRIK